MAGEHGGYDRSYGDPDMSRGVVVKRKGGETPFWPGTSYPSLSSLIGQMGMMEEVKNVCQCQAYRKSRGHWRSRGVKKGVLGRHKS